MSARSTLFLAVGLVALMQACAPESAPAPAGVGPAPNTRATEAGTKVELARPEPPPAATPIPEPVPERAPAPAAPTPAGADIADLGPFQVITWDEAKARAEKQIEPGNADVELEKLRVELENKP
ncbi:MAG: hypothetical protein NTY35_09925 [Planctomycetota bacterium]|nr:hypothetical protein [Planctomycetota bacterium]